MPLSPMFGVAARQNHLRYTLWFKHQSYLDVTFIHPTSNQVNKEGIEWFRNGFSSHWLAQKMKRCWGDDKTIPTVVLRSWYVIVPFFNLVGWWPNFYGGTNLGNIIGVHYRFASKFLHVNVNSKLSSPEECVCAVWSGRMKSIDTSHVFAN